MKVEVETHSVAQTTTTLGTAGRGNRVLPAYHSAEETEHAIAQTAAPALDLTNGT
jgi:hypothetical protein